MRTPEDLTALWQQTLDAGRTALPGISSGARSGLPLSVNVQSFGAVRAIAQGDVMPGPCAIFQVAGQWVAVSQSATQSVRRNQIEFRRRRSEAQTPKKNFVYFLIQAVFDDRSEIWSIDQDGKKIQHGIFLKEPVFEWFWYASAVNDGDILTADATIVFNSNLDLDVTTDLSTGPNGVFNLDVVTRLLRPWALAWPTTLTWGTDGFVLPGFGAGRPALSDGSAAVEIDAFPPTPSFSLEYGTQPVGPPSFTAIINSDVGVLSDTGNRYWSTRTVGSQGLDFLRTRAEIDNSSNPSGSVSGNETTNHQFDLPEYLVLKGLLSVVGSRVIPFVYSQHHFLYGDTLYQNYDSTIDEDAYGPTQSFDIQSSFFTPFDVDPPSNTILNPIPNWRDYLATFTADAIPTQPDPCIDLYGKDNRFNRSGRILYRVDRTVNPDGTIDITDLIGSDGTVGVSFFRVGNQEGNPSCSLGPAKTFTVDFMGILSGDLGSPIEIKALAAAAIQR